MTDPALAGALLVSALAAAFVAVFRRGLAVAVIFTAVTWGLYYLTRNPHAGATILLAAGLFAVNRYGILHLIRYGSAAFVFAAITWTNLQAGMLLPAAVGNAAGRMVRLVALLWAAYVAWRLVRERLGYLT